MYVDVKSKRKQKESINIRINAHRLKNQLLKVILLNTNKKNNSLILTMYFFKNQEVRNKLTKKICKIFQYDNALVRQQKT